MNRNVTATILIVLSVGIYLTFTRAKVAEVNAIRSVNAEYATAIGNAEQLIRVRDKVLKDYNALSSNDRERLEKMIPNTVDNIRLIIDMNSIALKHGFSLRNIKATAADKEETSSGAPRASVNRGPGGEPAGIPTPILDTVTVSFSVSTTYQKFIDFMHDLEANLRIMDISSLTLASSEDGVYDFGIELKTYWLREQ